MKRIRLSVLVTYICVMCVCNAQQNVENIFVERPTVALVLSGGGARGAAHVGVIRLIEEIGIPVDYVAGTSMGAIVGALYALGYTADEMDSLLMAQDWRRLLSNNVPRVMQPYAQREAERHYQISIPYENTVRMGASPRYRDAGIKVQGNSGKAFPKVLARPGIIDGQNLMNVFSELTIAYHDSIDYAELPRPFACVATDLVTGEAVVLDKGYIAESMRASMSIPGVFYPIYRGDQVLVDGGVVNNYPVNVARDMGADIVIGVDLNTGQTTAEELHSFAGIFERLIGTMGTELRYRNMADTDILILPDVGDYPVMGFDTLRLSRLIDIGYVTALQSKETLQALKARLDDYISPLPLLSDKGPDLGNPQTLLRLEEMRRLLTHIEVNGTDRASMLVLLAQNGIEEGGTFDETTLTNAIERIYGSGAFSAIQYHLTGSGPYTLELNVTPMPYNQVGVGLRVDSEDAAAALLSVGINRQKPSGPKLDLTTRLNINPWVEAHAAYAWHGMPQLNATLKYWFSDVNRFYSRSEHTFNYHYYGSDIYFSNLLSRNYDLRLGARYDNFMVHDLYREEFPELGYTNTKSQDSYIGMYVSLSNELFNTPYLPTHGYAYGASIAYNIDCSNYNTSNFWSIQADGSAAMPLGRHTVIQPTAYMRMLLGGNTPFIYGNAMGGYLRGRYLRQQLPFVGFTGCEFMKDKLAILRLDLRQQLLSQLFLTATVNYAYSTDGPFLSGEADHIWGIGAGLTYSTTAGPLSVNGYWSDMHHRFGAYLSFGYDF